MLPLSLNDNLNALQHPVGAGYGIGGKMHDIYICNDVLQMACKQFSFYFTGKSISFYK